MVAYQHITPPHVASRVLTFSDWCDYFWARERKTVICVVLATDPLAAVEMFHSVRLGVEMDGSTSDLRVQ